MTDNQKKIIKDSIILLAILILGIFLGRGTKHVDTSGVEKQIANKDTIIHLLTKEREATNSVIKGLEEKADLLSQKDSILTLQIQNTQSVYKLLNDKFKKVDDIITLVDHNRDSLLAAYSRYE